MTRTDTRAPRRARPPRRTPPTATTGGHWAARVHEACSTLAWCCALNAWWLGFTVLGGIVFGVGPATVAACVVSRRRTRGEAIHLRDFAAVWRRELVRGSVVVLPVLAAAGMLAANYASAAAFGSAAGAVRVATLAALAATAGVGSYVGPMYAHYDLPLRSYLPKATRFALARPASTVLLLFVFAALVFATAALPVLALVGSVGAWLHTSTWLCVRFFAENEDRLADADHSGTAQPVRALPAEPLRIR